MRAGNADGSLLVADVARCWCFQCEHNADAAAQSGSGATRASALRETHDARELERLIFETAAVHGQWLWEGKVCAEAQWDTARALDWSSAQVPVLYLRHFLLRQKTFNNDELWDCDADGTTPQWLVRMRAQFDGMRELLEVVLAPLSTTLHFVITQPAKVSEALDARRHFLADTYHFEFPDDVVEKPKKHTIARAMLLRVAVAYDVMAAVNGCKWDFSRVDVRVPWLKNAKLQTLDMYAQLFADTHLDLMVVCELHSRRYDDTFMASSMADSGHSDSQYAKSNAAPCALTMSMLERFYPHPVRAPFAGEISDLGSPLYATNSSASSSSSASHSILDPVTRFIFLKPLNYRAMRRSYADIGTRHMRDYPAIMQFHLNMIEVSQLGNIGGGARMRPRWSARLVVRRSFHFDKLKFEPSWCPNCGTGSQHFEKVTLSGNACPWCKPVERAVWCSNECMRGQFKLRTQVDLDMDDDEKNPGNRNVRLGGANARAADARAAKGDKVRRLEIDAAFEQLRAEHGACPHCEEEQERRAQPNSLLKQMNARQLLTYHFSSDHQCDYCKEREHDDAEYVRVAAAEINKSRKRKTTKVTTATEADEDDATSAIPPRKVVSDAEEQLAAQVAASMADIGNKMLCSSHVCAPCRMLRDNDRYCFNVIKEGLAFMIECDGLMEDQYTQSRSWEPYKRILFEGMDEVRSIIDAQFSLTAPSDWIAFRSTMDTLWGLVGEQVHLAHRCSQPTVSTMHKGSFMKLLAESMSKYKTKNYLNRMLTRPQRAVDFLRSPHVVLECAKESERESAKVCNEHASLAKWRERGYKPDDVRKVATLAANISINDEVDRVCPVFFNLLKYCGMSYYGVQRIQSACYDHEVCAMPDHRLEKDYVSSIAKNSRADFYILQYFTEIYLQREPIRIFPLALEAARAQMAALRHRYRLMPYDWAPEDIDVRYVCLCCTKWYSPIVAPVKESEIAKIIDSGGDATRLSEEISAVGHGDLKHNMRTGELMCSRDYKSSSNKRFKSYGMLDKDLSFANVMMGGVEAAASKASSIRKMRERGSDCSTKPLTAIAMLGVMVRIRGSMYAMCGKCASLFVVTKGKLFAGGIPDCGRHVIFGDPLAYESLLAFRSPLSEPARSGNWLQFGHQLLDSSRNGADLYSFEPAHINACVSELQYEYAAPRSFKSVQVMNGIAAEGWLRCTPSITHPKGTLEAIAVLTIQRYFLNFARGASSGAAPANAPVPDKEELDTALAHFLMTYPAAERRIRREEAAELKVCSEAHVELFDKASSYVDMALGPKPAADLEDGEIAAEPDADSVPDRVVAPFRAIRMRTEIHDEMLLRGGCVEDTVMIVCGYCGRVAEKRARYTRLEVMDIDNLCRNRHTRELEVRNGFDHSSKVEIFLCEKDFKDLKPLLGHFPTPTSAMVFVWLRCVKDQVLQAERNRKGAMRKGTSAADGLINAMAGTSLSAAAASCSDMLSDSTRRPRMSAVPESNSILSMSSKPRRGRRPGSGRGGARGSSGRKRGGGGGRGTAVKK